MQNNYIDAKRISLNLLDDIKYMYASSIVGILSMLVCNYGLPLEQDVVEGLKDAIVDYFYDGMDPDFDNYAMMKWFDGLNADWFELTDGGKSLKCNKNISDFIE